MALGLPVETTAENDAPAYAKWGNIAVTETIKKYPYADVVDYLHIGREEKGDGIAVEKFKLWLRHDKKEFGVFVNVEFEINTNQFKSISFQETDR
nr:YqzG/YhdC family protein [Anaerobacillus sp. CMMVII]